MPSLDERREVAARLREQKTWDIFTNFEDCIGDLCAAVFEDEGDLNDMFRLQAALADLIEPEPERTCRIVGMDVAGNPPYNTSGLHLNDTSPGCSECGFPFRWCRSLIQARAEVVACPRCGAKVVSE